METSKPVHTVILDAGPLIKNDPSVSSILGTADVLITHPSVIGEIRDAATRSRLETTLRPFLSLREPKPESVRFVQEFARKSGDLQSLSRPDILLLALTYEVECERNGGDWRLRRVPGQKRVNGSAPDKAQGAEVKGGEEEEEVEGEEDVKTEEGQEVKTEEEGEPKAEEGGQEEVKVEEVGATLNHTVDGGDAILEEEPRSTIVAPQAKKMVWGKEQPSSTSEALDTETAEAMDLLRDVHISSDTARPTDGTTSTPPLSRSSSPASESESDSDDWITPTNLRKHQARDASTPSTTTASKKQVLQSALLTTDYAMQNVALLLNLNLLSSALVRITQLRTTVQRCHACFFVIRPTAANTASGSAQAKPKQFCPRCGLPTLTRVSCSTSASTGQFAIHLKKNMQWSNRGARYSVPKPTAGTSSGLRTKGGGKGGWGNELLLAEDQKEYTRAVQNEERRNRRERDLMDDEFLGGLLGGGKGLAGGGRAGGRVKVGAGRDVNSKKRR